MIQPLHIEADVTASVGDHEVRFHGEDELFVVEASSWAPLLQLRRMQSSLGFRLPDLPRQQAGLVEIRVRGKTVVTLRLEAGRIRRRVHPINAVRSLFG